MRKLLPFLFALASAASLRMTVADVLRLVRAGVSEDIILEQIRVQHRPFDLTADQLIELKQGHVSERVIRAMLAPPATPAPNASPQAPSHAPKSPEHASAPLPQAGPRTSAPPVTPVRWVSHGDPMGFALKLPAGWQLQADRKAGRITIRGTRSEQVVIWPVFIERQSLDRQTAGALLKQLARRVHPDLAWGEPQMMADAGRVLARGAVSGATVMRWNVMPDGTGVYLFSVTAAAALYRDSADVFTEILASFQVTPAPAAAPANSAPDRQAVQWTRWTDPREGAFSASIPRGWSVTGGTVRHSATDVRKSLVTIAPGRQIRIALGDAGFGVFAVPNAMYASAGLREGMTTSLGDGSRLQLRRFLTAAQFLRQYIVGPALSDCTGVTIASENTRPDLAAASEQEARAQHAPNVRITTGGISFSCTWNGKPARGYYAAATVLVPMQMGGLWYVDSLYGYVAEAEHAQEAEALSRHVYESAQVNSDWKRQEDQMAANAVQQDNARAAEIQARARQSIAADQQAISDTIVKGYEARSRVYDEISRKRENAILGTVDVVDPNTGRQYKVDNYSDYHWMNNQGVIAGTRTDTAPGIDWRQMVTLP